MEMTANSSCEAVSTENAPKTSFTEGAINYEYVLHDQLRNNRPSHPIVVSTDVIDNSNRSQNSACHSSAECSQIPRMASTLGDYEVICTTGNGTYGTCKKIRRKKDGRIMVWKEINFGEMSDSEKQMLVSEVNLLRELRHPYIVRYSDRIIDRKRSLIYIVMEYCQGGDMATMIAQNRLQGSHISEEFAWKILIQTTLALKECHHRKNGKPVLHRDLKPANVFLDGDSNVKLGDFGLARELRHDNSFATTFVGTPYYMSPELVNNQSYNEKSDIWSLGCMMYEVCALSPPFVACNQTDLNRKIRMGHYPSLPNHYSLELDMVIRKMIQVEVSKRPSINSILADPMVLNRKEYSLCMKIVANHKRQDTATLDIVKDVGHEQGDIKYSDILTKMRLLDLKEKELENREKNVALREKLAEEKFQRACGMLEMLRSQEETSSFSSQWRFNPISPGRHRLTPPDNVLSPAQRHKDRASPIGRIIHKHSPCAVFKSKIDENNKY